MTPDLRSRWGALRYRYEVLALLGLVLATRLLDPAAPRGILLLGGVAGAGVLIQAIGIILVYRTGRFINFAQVQLGAAGAVLFVGLVNGRLPLRLLDSVCGCAAAPGPGLLAFNWFLALILGLVLAGLTGLLSYHVVIRRFANQPRLVLTIATVFLGQTITVLGDFLGRQLVTGDQRAAGINPYAAATPPFELELRVGGDGGSGGVLFRVDSVALVLVSLAALLGISGYLRYSAAGNAILAAADSPARARTLGMDVDSLTSRVWVIAGLLSGAAAIIAAFVSPVGDLKGGTAGALSISVEQIVIILTAAVVARFSSLVVAGLAALTLMVGKQALVWAFQTPVAFQSSLVLVLGALLLVQRRELSRSDLDAGGAWRATREIRPTPSELRNLPPVRKAKWGFGGVALVVLLGLPWVVSPSSTSLGSSYVALAIAGLSLLVLTGWGGQISLGQFGFAAIGAWTTAVVPLPFPLAPIVGGLGGALAAVVVGLPAIKLRGLHLAITSLAFAVSASAIFLGDGLLGKQLPDTLARPRFLGISLDDERTFYYLTLMVLLLCIGAVAGVRRSRTGRALIAVRDNEPGAQAFGINLTAVRLAAFAFSGFLAAIAGSLYAYDVRAVGGSGFAPETSLTVFLFAVIGGLSGIAGPLLGFIYLAVLQSLGGIPGAARIGSGPVGLLLLVAVPGGLSQLLYGTRDAFLRRVAARYRIPVPSLISDKKAGADDNRAPLLERTRSGTAGDFFPTRYEPTGQWALSRYGDDDAVKERVGA